jgi:hypothetical protein
VQSFKFPLSLPGEWIEYKIHGDTITQVRFLKIEFERSLT